MPILLSVAATILFAAVFLIALSAVIRGYKGIKLSGSFDPDKPAERIGYWLLAAAHLWTGVLVLVCYAIALILLISM